MKDNQTPKLFISYMSQFRATYQKARRRLKERINTKTSTFNSNLQDQQVCDPVDDTNTCRRAIRREWTSLDIQLEENELAITSSPKETSTLGEPIMRNCEKPEIGEYWERLFECSNHWERSIYCTIFRSNCKIWRLQTKRSKIRSVTRGLCLKVGKATVDSCAKKKSSELFLYILSTNKHFYHYCCVTSISKYIYIGHFLYHFISKNLYHSFERQLLLSLFLFNGNIR